MKKKKNIALIVLGSALLIVGLISIIFRVLQDENNLTITEKSYITNNKSNLISINVVNDANVFGDKGNGIFYDFLEDFENEMNLTFNIVTKSINENLSGLSLTKGDSIPNEGNVFYIDHYVLVGKSETTFATLKDVNQTIGILNSDYSKLSTYITNYSLTNKTYDNRTTLLEGFANNEVNFIIVPLYEYLDSILENLYVINYHISDAKVYYYLQGSNDQILNSILTKFYNVWIEEEFLSSLNENQFSLFSEKLKVTEKELDIINSKKYTFGFVENSPYVIKSNGGVGGIIIEYLERFKDFSDIEIEYKEYSNYNKLNNGINRKNIDLYFNFFEIQSDYPKVKSLYTMDISFIMNDKDKRTFTSINSIKNEKIYVLENSKTHVYLKNTGLKVETFKNIKNIKKLLKKNVIIALDYENYLIYNRDNNLNINERFRVNTSASYDFASNCDTMFNRLLSYYINTIDKNEIMYTGLYNYETTSKSNLLIQNVIKTTILIIGLIVGITYGIYKFNTKVRITRKIKKNEKIKYIDMLTSLKNRNFLSENLPTWNQNTIYPQAVIVIDLNSVQELNDSYGYLEGDKQIQAAANVLIKTQLDNTEIMRTDGNEFTIYMLGYSEKQVLSYIKKLGKEFKNLPHDKGAAIGFSMILDDVKLIDDAINEATEKMKANKELIQGEMNEEKI